MDKKHQQNSIDYSIGIVTYVGRYKKYFLEGMKNLSEIFSDKEIICVINGHYDKTLQIEYLRSITSYLQKFPNVKYITNEENQSLSKCWNWTILMKNTPRILILNDDLKISSLFRHDFEKNLKNNQTFFIINNSWSHFLISDDIIKKVGWFEERLPGVGFEDLDYMFRLTKKIIPITIMKCKGIINYAAKQENAGWKNFSNETEGKYTMENRKFMEKKWFFNFFENNEKVNYDIIFKLWNNKVLKAKIKPDMETPIFYDFNNLENNNNLPKFTYKGIYKKKKYFILFINFLSINFKKIINKFKIKK